MPSITHQVSCQVPNQKNKPSVDAIVEFVQIHRTRQAEGGWQEELTQYKAQRIVCPEYDGIQRKCMITKGLCEYSRLKPLK